MKKTQQPQVAAPGAAITPEQIQAWQNQNGDVYQIDVQVDENDTATCYIKEPRREHYARVMSLYSDDKMLQAGEFLVTNCWLGGDERCKTVDKIAMSAAMKAITIVRVLPGEIKKL